VLGEYLREDAQRGDAVTFYAFGLLLPATAWFLLWWYGRARGLLLEGLAPRYVNLMTLQYVISMGIYSAALVASLVEPWAGLAICTGITAVYLLPPRRPSFEG
jgi:hypothetical protein